MKICFYTKEKIMSLIFMIVLFLMVTLIWACVPMPVQTTKGWSKTNLTQQEFSKDKYECIQQSQQTKNDEQGTTGTDTFYEPGHASSKAVINQTLFKLCMEARGWMEILEEKPASDDFTGRTTYTYGNDDKYEGDFVNGKLQGRGTLTWGPKSKWAGDKYEGGWVNGKQQGKGIYTYGNGDKYEGDFVNGKMQGRGTLTWGPKSKWTGDKYEGDWVNDKQQGKGIFTYGNGDKYEGDWINGKQQSRGTFTYGNGDKYEGDFVDGKFTSRGKFTCSNGKQFTENLDNIVPAEFTTRCN